jgi:hypothetical protein
MELNNKKVEGNTFSTHQPIMCTSCTNFCNQVLAFPFKQIGIVVTLTLGSQPRQGLAKVQAKSEAQESHFMLPGM